METANEALVAPADSFRVENPPEAPSWHPASHIAFRIAFLYFFCFLFCFGNGTIFSLIPVVGDWIESIFDWPFNHLAEWTGTHLFHLTGLAAHWHPTGSGDTTLNWILNGLFAVFALAGGLIWTLAAVMMGDRRKEYATLYAWLRFGLRLTCGFFMINYGVAKVFPLQMPPISVAILNEPVGNMSPMTFLWALIGMNPAYEIVCGAAEVLGGLLLLVRPTALLGALLSTFVMSNVVLYNFFFDVPVKIFAANLLLALLFLVLQDLGPLFSFFWSHRPTTTVGVWIPPMKRRWARITMLVVESAFALGFVVGMPVLVGMEWFPQVKESRVPTPLVGAWKLDPVDPARLAGGPFSTGDGLPATDLYVDNAVRGFTRATDGALWRTRFKLDPKQHTAEIRCFPSPPVTFSYQIVDNNHLTLTSMPPEVPKSGANSKSSTKLEPTFIPLVLTLKRTPLPDRYPLLDRGFHYVNQWGLER